MVEFVMMILVVASHIIYTDDGTGSPIFVFLHCTIFGTKLCRCDGDRPFRTIQWIVVWVKLLKQGGGGVRPFSSSFVLENSS